MAFWKRLLGDENLAALRAALPIVATVNAREEEMKALSDDALKAKTTEFRKRLAEGVSIDDLAPEAFAVVREASRRTSACTFLIS